MPCSFPPSTCPKASLRDALPAPPPGLGALALSPLFLRETHQGWCWPAEWVQSPRSPPRGWARCQQGGWAERGGGSAQAPHLIHRGSPRFRHTAGWPPHRCHPRRTPPQGCSSPALQPEKGGAGPRARPSLRLGCPHSHPHRCQLPSGNLDWGRRKQAGWRWQNGPCERGCLARGSPNGDHPPRQESSSAASGQSGCPSQSRAGGRHRPSAQASQPWGHGQPCSSVPSPQSSCPSQSWARRRQRPDLQDICPSPQPGVAQPGVGQAGRLRTLTESQRRPPPQEDQKDSLPTSHSCWQWERQP